MGLASSQTDERAGVAIGLHWPLRGVGVVVVRFLQLSGTVSQSGSSSSHVDSGKIPND